MTKKTAMTWCAKYIKLRDVIEDYPVTHDLELVRCRTCGKWLRTKSKDSQAGHFIGRGMGGSSGVYFDERNIHIQGSVCNRFKQGAPKEYREYMLKKYGEDIVNELYKKHHIPLDRNYTAIGELYKQEYKRLQQITKEIVK